MTVGFLPVPRILYTSTYAAAKFYTEIQKSSKYTGAGSLAGRRRIRRSALWGLSLHSALLTV